MIVLIGLSGYAWGANEPKIDVHLEQLTSTDDMFYFRGPVNIQYRLTVSNPTDQPVTLRRLELSTLGPGSYSLHTGSSPVTRTLAPHGTTSLTLSASRTGSRRLSSLRGAGEHSWRGLLRRCHATFIREAVHRELQTVERNR